jgi:hypothetical protein
MLSPLSREASVGCSSSRPPTARSHSSTPGAPRMTTFLAPHCPRHPRVLGVPLDRGAADPGGAAPVAGRSARGARTSAATEGASSPTGRRGDGARRPGARSVARISDVGRTRRHRGRRGRPARNPDQVRTRRIGHSEGMAETGPPWKRPCGSSRPSLAEIFASTRSRVLPASRAITWPGRSLRRRDSR